MLPGPTGEKHPWDVKLNGIPFRAVRRAGDAIDFENGTPVWDEFATPATAGKDVELIQRERRWSTWHLGAGYNYQAIEGGYAYGTGVDGRFPGQLLCPPAVTQVTTDSVESAVNTFFEINQLLYCLKGRYCKQINTSTDAFVTISGADGSTGKDFGASTTATSAINFDGKTIVGFSSATQIYSFTGSAWTQKSDATTMYGERMARVWNDNATAYVLAATTDVATQIRVCAQNASPLTGTNWTGATTIGETTSTITGMGASEKTLWIAKYDGLYYIDMARTPRVIETRMGNAPATVPITGTNTYVDPMGIVYFPTREGFYRYDPNTGEAADVTPCRGLPNSYIVGTVAAVTTHRGWIWVGTYNGTNSQILCGRLRESGEPGVGPIIWHGALYTVAAWITSLHVTSLTTTPRLYMGFNDGTVRYFELPSFGDNPTLDSNVNYASTAIAYMSIDDWGVPGSRWQPIAFEFESTGLGTPTVVAALLCDNNEFTIALGTLNTSPRQTLTVPTASTTITTAVDSDDVTAVVLSATGFPSSNPYYAWIESECVKITAGAGTTSWTITRAARGTTAAAHAANATIVLDNRFTNAQLRLTWSVSSTTTPVVIRGITGYAIQRAPSLYKTIETTLYCSDRVAGLLGAGHRLSGKQQLAALEALQNGTVVQLVDYWTGSARTQTAILGPIKKSIVVQTDPESADMVVTVPMTVIA